MSLIKNLFYTVGDFHLKIPEWSFPDEGVSVLSGPSGSGKTTLVHILCGLIPVKNFEWHFKGQDLAQLSPPDRQLGVLFQELHLFPHLSVKKNLLFAAQARKLPLKETEKNLKKMTSLLNMEKKLSLLPEQLSGGEKQRVALMRALIGNPRFLILDEPFCHLDEKTAQEARELTHEVLKEKSLPTLLISHDSQNITFFANQTFTLKEGEIQVV